MPVPIFILCDLGVLGGQFAFLYVDLRLRVSHLACSSPLFVIFVSSVVNQFSARQRD
jgi:hypothetical protein